MTRAVIGEQWLLSSGGHELCGLPNSSPSQYLHVALSQFILVSDLA
jgi:hypothetical protein